MLQPDEIVNAAALAALGALCLLGLRRLVLMDGLHGLRVVVFTLLLWAVVFYLLAIVWPSFSDVYCGPAEGEAAAFACTET